MAQQAGRQEPVQYVPGNGQHMKSRSGRLFVLQMQGNRIELCEPKTGEVFVLIDFLRILPSLKVIHRIAQIATGERLGLILAEAPIVS